MQTVTNYDQELLDMAELTDFSPDPDPLPYLMLPLDVVVNTPENQLIELAVSAGRMSVGQNSFLLVNFAILLIEQLDDDLAGKIQGAFNLGVSTADNPPF